MPYPERALSNSLVRLRACVCEELAESLAGPVCRCHVVHSDEPILDGCNCACPDGATGRAWLRVVTIRAVAAMQAQFTPCPSEWVATVQIGVSRCVLDGSPEIPPDETLESEALRGLSDFAALRRAVVCCARKGTREKIRAIQWDPLGPDGLCYGGMLTIEITFS